MCMCSNYQNLMKPGSKKVKYMIYTYVFVNIITSRFRYLKPAFDTELQCSRACMKRLSL